MKVNLKLRKPTHPEAAAQPKLRVSRLKKREVRRKFQLELDARFKHSRCKVEERVTNTQKEYQEIVQKLPGNYLAEHTR